MTPKRTRRFSELEDTARAQHEGWDEDVAAIKRSIETDIAAGRQDEEFRERLRRRHESERELFERLKNGPDGS
jgi:hypothetical protein